MHSFHGVIGKTITSTMFIEGYHQIVMGNSTLTIYSPIEVRRNNDIVGIANIVGSKIMGIDIHDDDVAITTDRGILLTVDIRDATQTSPESMVFHAPGQPIVVL